MHYTDTYSNAHVDSNRDGNSHPDTNANAHSDANR